MVHMLLRTRAGAEFNDAPCMVCLTELSNLRYGMADWQGRVKRARTTFIPLSYFYNQPSPSDFSTSELGDMYQDQRPGRMKILFRVDIDKGNQQQIIH